jgi:hypothetical protein
MLPQSDGNYIGGPIVTVTCVYSRCLIRNKAYFHFFKAYKNLHDSSMCEVFFLAGLVYQSRRGHCFNLFLYFAHMKLLQSYRTALQENPDPRTLTCMIILLYIFLITHINGTIA